MAFLTREFSVLLPFVAIVAVFLAVSNQGILRFQALSFVLGAGASALAGFIGMRVATAANSRTTHAAREGITPALKSEFYRWQYHGYVRGRSSHARHPYYSCRSQIFPGFHD
jgi:K(+)-stimulated pyrophosphate-energized sodium pump